MVKWVKGRDKVAKVIPCLATPLVTAHCEQHGVLAVGVTMADALAVARLHDRVRHPEVNS